MRIHINGEKEGSLNNPSIRIHGIVFIPVQGTALETLRLRNCRRRRTNILAVGRSEPHYGERNAR